MLPSIKRAVLRILRYASDSWREDFLAGADIDGVVAGCDPQTDDISTVIADNLRRLHAVA